MWRCKALRHQRGAVLLMVAGFVMVMLAMAALAIDIGQLCLAAQQLQDAADAAALAGVGALRNSTGGELDEDAAKAAAVDIAARNFVLARSVVLDPDRDIVVGGYNEETGQIEPWDGTQSSVAVKVTAHTTVPTMFASALGINSADLHSRPAIAGLKVGGETREPLDIIIIQDASRDFGSGGAPGTHWSDTSTDWARSIDACEATAELINQHAVPGDRIAFAAYTGPFAYGLESKLVPAGTPYSDVWMWDNAGQNGLYREVAETYPEGVSWPSGQYEYGYSGVRNVWKWFGAGIKRTMKNPYWAGLETVDEDGDPLPPEYGGTVKTIATGFHSLTPGADLPTALRTIFTVARKDNPGGGADVAAGLEWAKQMFTQYPSANRKVVILITKNKPYSLRFFPSYNPEYWSYYTMQARTDARAKANEISGDNIGSKIHTIALEPTSTEVYSWNKDNLTKKKGFALRATDSSKLEKMLGMTLKCDAGRPFLIH